MWFCRYGLDGFSQVQPRAQQDSLALIGRFTIYNEGFDLMTLLSNYANTSYNPPYKQLSLVIDSANKSAGPMMLKKQEDVSDGRHGLHYIN